VSLAEPLPSRLPLGGDRGVWRTVVLGVALFGGGLLALQYLGRGPGPALAGVGFTFGIMSLVMAGFRYLSQRKDRAVADAMAAGDYIAYWIVPSEVWRAHLASEHAASLPAFRIATIAGFGIGLALVALILGIEAANDRDVSGFLVPAEGFLVGTTVVFGIVGLVMQLLQGARLRHLARSPGVICIADRALYHAGELWPHDRAIPRFLGVQLLPGPPRLLEFSYRFSSPKGSHTEVVRVPMPRTDEVIRPDDILARLNAR
jgi:hypothetical protein